MYHTSDQNLSYHYLFFLLKIIEYPELQGPLGIKNAINSFALLLMNYEDGVLWNNLYDRIYHRFTKTKYKDFLTGTYLTYRQRCTTDFLEIFFNYLDKKYNQGILSKVEILWIVDDTRTVTDTSPYRIKRKAWTTDRRAKQQQTFKKIYEFKKKWSPEQYSLKASIDRCLTKRKKRSVLCSIGADVQKDPMQQRLMRHVNQVTRIVGFVSTGLFTKDMLVDLLHGDFKSVAINAGLLLGGRISERLSQILEAEGDTLIVESSVLRELVLENDAIPIFSKGSAALVNKRFFGKVLKTAAPFVERATLVYFFYNLYDDSVAYEAGDSKRLVWYGSFVFS